MSLEKRLDRLEGYCPKQRTVKDMTDNELVELIIPGTKPENLTDEELQIIARISIFRGKSPGHWP